MKFLINKTVSASRKFYGYLKKDMLLLIRRKKYLYLSILIPLIIGMLFLFFLNPNLNNIKVGICDYDSTQYSRQAVSDLRGFSVTFLPRANCTEQILNDIKIGKYSLGLEIPNGFSQKIHDLKQAKILVYYDNTDIAFSSLVDWKVDQSMASHERSIINLLNSELKTKVAAIRSGVDFISDLTKDYQIANSRMEKIDQDLKSIEDLETEFILNPIWTEKVPVYRTEQTKDAGIAFVFPIIALFIVLMLASTSFIYDKKTNFLVRVKSSTTPLIYILAKLVFFFLITLVNFLIILFLFIAYGANYSYPIFKILNLLLFISVINTLLGMLIGLISENEGIAILFSFVISFPFMLLSGVFYPLQTMPGLMQYIAKIIPLNYQIEYSKAVMLFGQSIGLKWIITALILLFLVNYLITRKN